MQGSAGWDLVRLLLNRRGPGHGRDFPISLIPFFDILLAQNSVLCTAVVLPSVKTSTNYDPNTTEYTYLCSWRQSWRQVVFQLALFSASPRVHVFGFSFRNEYRRRQATDVQLVRERYKLLTQDEKKIKYALALYALRSSMCILSCTSNNTLRSVAWK